MGSAYLPLPVFLGIIWGTEALACILLAFRIFYRLHSQQRLYWDDGLIIFALLLTLVTAALWQWAGPVMYWTLQFSEGRKELTTSPEVYFDKYKLWTRVIFVVALFFYTSLTAVKLSFLLFFRRLGNRVYAFKWIWWPTLILVLSIWIIGIGTSVKEAECEVPKEDLEVLIIECSSSTSTNFDANHSVIKVMLVLDVVSDFLIVLIPVGLLWNVKMPLHRKLALLGLFSLSLVTIAIAIARVADISATAVPGSGFNPRFLWLWTAVEPCIAIVVACLSAFPRLFSGSDKKFTPAHQPVETYSRRLASRLRPGRAPKSGDEDLFELTLVSSSVNDEAVPPLNPYALESERRSHGLGPDPEVIEPVSGVYHGGKDHNSLVTEGQMTRDVENQAIRK